MQGGDAGKALERPFPSKPNEEGHVRVYTLAPLSKNNIRQAAASRGRDGEDLLRCISDKDAQSLATHPITFEILFKIYLEGGDLPASRVELYERGCLQLCMEPHSEFGSTQQRCTTAPQRLAIASRLAALSVLTNRYLINGDPERSLCRADVLEAAHVCGFFKESAGGEHVEVNRATTTDALQTALFSERVEGVQTWRHQSYAEFLAARYLAQRGMPSEQVVALLTDTTDNSHRLIPQLEEAACWLADMTPAVFDVLAPSNAELFIRCDPGNLSAQRRAMLVERYLDLVRRHEAPEVDWQLKHRFERLSHPRLANQLGQVIVNRNEHVLVRETAIEIAAFCRSATLAAELIEVFLDRSDVPRLRTRAGFALEQMRNSQIQTTLKKKATAESLDDPSDELKGFYLKILWPSHLSLDELLKMLTPPKRRNFTGSYRGFFEYQLPRSIPDSDLPTVLDWLREKNVDFDILAPFGHFPTKITARAYERLEEPQTRNAFIQLLRSQLHELHSFFGTRTDKNRAEAKIRQSFWLAVVEAELDVRELITQAHLHEASLLDQGDLSFFVERYRAALSERHRESWRTLTFFIFDPENQTALEQLSDLASTDQQVADLLAARTSCPLLPDERNWPKQEFERRRKAEAARAEERKPSLTKRIESAVAAFEQGTVHAVWYLVDLADMRKAARRAIWQRPEPKTLMRAFSDLEKRLIRTSGDLHSALVESIQRFEATLHAAPPSLELWNDPKEGTETIWSPKDENNLSTRLAIHFKNDLVRRGIIADREVEIKPRLGPDPAQLVDLLVTAIPFTEDGKPDKPLTVVVEVKCAWNRGVLEDMERQLYARYLGNSELDFGIYVVAYFTCGSWNRKGDARRSDGASKMAIEDLRARLFSQAQKLSSSEKRIDSLIIDARLGRDNSRA